MNIFRRALVLFVLVCGACDDTPPAKDPANPSASSTAAPATHSPSHGQFTGP